VALIVPVTTIVGDTDEEVARDRAAAKQMLSFYGSTPNYAFIWDEAGFEGTTARIREKQKAGDVAGMAAEITDDHLATFCTESTWDGLAAALTTKYAATTERLVLYNAGNETTERFEKYGEVARRISTTTST
jgi:alkanesulfonate monooxygenase SsuD/methylene tetrahydromethanopterin reductase-like flavin-dependent oxidoreductase (luciferase family)